MRVPSPGRACSTITPWYNSDAAEQRARPPPWASSTAARHPRPPGSAVRERGACAALEHNGSLPGPGVTHWWGGAVPRTHRQKGRRPLLRLQRAGAAAHLAAPVLERASYNARLTATRAQQCKSAVAAIHTPHQWMPAPSGMSAAVSGPCGVHSGVPLKQARPPPTASPSTTSFQICTERRVPEGNVWGSVLQHLLHLYQAVPVQGTPGKLRIAGTRTQRLPACRHRRTQQAAPPSSASSPPNTHSHQTCHCSCRTLLLHSLG